MSGETSYDPPRLDLAEEIVRDAEIVQKYLFGKKKINLEERGHPLPGELSAAFDNLGIELVFHQAMEAYDMEYLQARIVKKESNLKFKSIVEFKKKSEFTQLIEELNNLYDIVVRNNELTDPHAGSLSEFHKSVLLSAIDKIRGELANCPAIESGYMLRFGEWCKILGRKSAEKQIGDGATNALNQVGNKIREMIEKLPEPGNWWPF